MLDRRRRFGRRTKNGHFFGFSLARTTSGRTAGRGGVAYPQKKKISVPSVVYFIYFFFYEYSMYLCRMSRHSTWKNFDSIRSSDTLSRRVLNETRIKGTRRFGASECSRKTSKKKKRKEKKWWMTFFVIVFFNSHFLLPWETRNESSLSVICVIS